MLQFNNNHIFTGYLKQFLSSFNLPTCRIYTAEFEKYYAEHGCEHPKVIESNLPILISEQTDTKRSAVGITYLKNGSAQQYFWDTSNWNVDEDVSNNKAIKYWKTTKTTQYNGNKILGLTKTLKNPTTLYNYQTHEYLGDYLRFLRDYEGINLMSMYNCFSNKLCNNLKETFELKINNDGINQATRDTAPKGKTVVVEMNSFDTGYKIYMLPVKLFEKYTIALDCYQGVEMFCGLYNDRLETTPQARDLEARTYFKCSKTLFHQPFIYDKLDETYWNWRDENTLVPNSDGTSTSTLRNTTKFLRAELASKESELKLFIKVPASNKSSIVVLEGDYRNYNDSLLTIKKENGLQKCEYVKNSTITNFETRSIFPDLNSREFKPISKLQLLALNTGISYPFADRLIEYLVSNVIVPNDVTPDNIIRLQKVMEDCGYTFQIEGVWEPKMQMILYDYLMNSGKFVSVPVLDKDGNPVLGKQGKPTYKLKDRRTGNLKQRGQKLQANYYDILGYVDKDAEKLYASWTLDDSTGKVKVVAKNTLENIDIYSNLYNN